MFDIKVNRDGSTMNVELTGVLDTKTAPEFEEAVMGSLGDLSEIHFDFANLEFLTSAGLRALLEVLQEMDDKDGVMTLKNVNDDIMGIFKLTGFINVLTIE